MADRHIYIQSNRKQYLGAKVAKYALETRGGAAAHDIGVTILQVDDMPLYTSYAGMTYGREGEVRTHDPDDLQFFTLSRFMPPELMHYAGRALVIDPDIFALQDITSLFDLELGDSRLAACHESTWWDTSMMVLDCAKLRDWDIANLLEGLKNGTEDYSDWMRLYSEKNVYELPRVWNSIDRLTPETKMLHTSKRLTQPWKTGLPVDFIHGTVPKVFGIIPRFWVHQPSHYQPHPNKDIEHLFFTLFKESRAAGAVTEADIDEAIKNRDIRPDARAVLARI